jgi:hypothetical protein
MHHSQSTLSVSGPQKFLCVISAFALAAVSAVAEGIGENGLHVPILVYHRFGPVVADSMTLTTPVFASHLKHLQENDYTVIPLRQLIGYHMHEVFTLPTRSVVITVDDGHRSVYTYVSLGEAVPCSRYPFRLPIGYL